MPMAIVNQTCQVGGGALVVRRSSIAKVFTGGTKLITVLNVEFGSRAIGAAVWVAAKVFRVGLLLHGKPPDFATLVRWVRAA